MAFVRQRRRMDCGVAALAMLCDVTYEEAYATIPWGERGVSNGTTTRQMRLAGEKLGYFTVSNARQSLQPLRNQSKRVREGRLSWDIWEIIPNNSLVKIPHPEGRESHWVVWRKNKIYDPARGAFTPEKYAELFPYMVPTSFMMFMKRST